MPVGYRVVSFDQKEKKAQNRMMRKPVDLALGSVHEYQGGVFLGSTEAFTQYYLGGTDDQDVILTFEYEAKDVLNGEVEPNSEVLVSRAVLVEARFENEHIQERFGHLLDPSINDRRREQARGNNHESIAAGQGSRRLSVIRAMDARVGHVHPMDYVYTLEAGSYFFAAKRVLAAYEEGTPVRTSIDRSIMKALEHAVTTAIYEGEPQQVSFASVSSKDVYQAPNTGESFFDGSAPVQVTRLFSVDQEGAVSLHSKDREAELTA